MSVEDVKATWRVIMADPDAKVVLGSFLVAILGAFALGLLVGLVFG